MLRGLAAVLAGLAAALVVALASSFAVAYLLGDSPGTPATPLYLALNLLGSVVAGVSGGAMAGWIAPGRPHGHAGALALLLLLLSLPAVLSAPAPGQPAWYPVALSVVAPLSVVVGAFLTRRRSERRKAPARV